MQGKVAKENGLDQLLLPLYSRSDWSTIHFSAECFAMTRLPATLQALETGQPPKPALRDELRRLPETALPLQKFLRQGNRALHDRLEPVILHCEEKGDGYELRCELFFHSLISGCQCSGDLNRLQRIDESVQLTLRIHRPDGDAELQLQFGPD